jgi:hypothetical protein
VFNLKSKNGRDKPLACPDGAARRPYLKEKNYRPQQFLYFLPLPQGHGSLRPTFGPTRFGFGFSLETSSAAWLTTSLAFGSLGLFLSPKALGGS